MKTIGIVGSRRRDSMVDFKICENEFLKHYEKGDKIVSGGCPEGGDRFAEIIALKHGIDDNDLIIHYAKWNLGKHAGFLRNGDIARDCDILIAVVASDRTGGTEDTIKKAEKLGKKIILI